MNALNHLAIIMDGNGRWAKKQGLLRTKGHESGAKVVEDIAIYCAKNCIKTLTLYAFSTENWSRPQNEVDFLMDLLKKFLISKRQMIVNNNIKFHTIGDISAFRADLQDEITKLKELSAKFNGLNLVLALNYGSRDEIVRACKALCEQGKDISQSGINACLDTKEFGDVDLLIRTGGEQRLSNFLLWQASYAEFAFTNTFWPEFSVSELEQIINNYKGRNRRFGGL